MWFYRSSPVDLAEIDQQMQFLCDWRSLYNAKTGVRNRPKEINQKLAAVAEACVDFFVTGLQWWPRFRMSNNRVTVKKGPSSSSLYARLASIKSQIWACEQWKSYNPFLQVHVTWCKSCRLIARGGADFSPHLEKDHLKWSMGRAFWCL